MSAIFWTAVIVLAAFWAYKNKATVKGWFKKDKTPPTPAADCPPAATDVPPPSSGAPTPPSNAPPAA